jgi:hypothetical protein
VASTLTRGALGHDDDGVHAEGAGRVGDGLGVVAAGVGDHPSPALFRREGGDLVVGAAQLERAGRLQVLRLEKEGAVLLAARARDQRRPEGHPADPALREPNIVQRDHGPPPAAEPSRENLSVENTPWRSLRVVDGAKTR